MTSELPSLPPVRPHNPPIRSPLPRWTVPAVALLVLVVAVAVLVALWMWIDDLALTDIEKRTSAHLDAVKIAASIAVGGGGIFALYLATRRQRTQELELQVRQVELVQRDRVQAHAEEVAENNKLHAVRVAEATERDAAERRVTELYSKSIEQLGSANAAVRLGGLYALERLAHHDSLQRQSIVNVMCAYLRMPFIPPVHPSADEQVGEVYEQWMREREVRIAVQRVLAGHLRVQAASGCPSEAFWPNMDLDLSGAVLEDFTLSGCSLRKADFTEARMIKNASFDNCIFADRAVFHKVSFGGGFVSFNGARFSDWAVFSKAGFVDPPWFNGAHFGGMTLFNDATFPWGAQFDKAKFTGVAYFKGAQFDRVATFDNVAVLATAERGKDVWPQGWTVDIETTLVQNEERWHPLVPASTESSPPAE